MIYTDPFWHALLWAFLVGAGASLAVLGAWEGIKWLFGRRGPAAGGHR